MECTQSKSPQAVRVMRRQPAWKVSSGTNAHDVQVSFRVVSIRVRAGKPFVRDRQLQAGLNYLK